MHIVLILQFFHQQFDSKAGRLSFLCIVVRSTKLLMLSVSSDTPGSSGIWYSWNQVVLLVCCCYWNQSCDMISDQLIHLKAARKVHLLFLFLLFAQLHHSHP